MVNYKMLLANSQGYKRIILSNISYWLVTKFLSLICINDRLAMITFSKLTSNSQTTRENSLANLLLTLLATNWQCKFL